MSEAIGYLILAALAVCILLLVVLIIMQRRGDSGDSAKEITDAVKQEISGGNSALRGELTSSVQSSVKLLGDFIGENQKSTSNMQNKRLDDINSEITQKQEAMSNNLLKQIKQLDDSITSVQRAAAEAQDKRLSAMNISINEKQSLMIDNVQKQINQLETRFKTFESTNVQQLTEIRETISKRLTDIQVDNNKRLDEMRATVDEKLQKTLDEKMTNSFKLVSERLEQVYKGLGEMQAIAAGVGDLKKVLSHVKTRGILGEIQLGAILGEILTPEQYDTEVATIPGSRDHVEFAIKLPAAESGKTIYLPIDSKFPGDTYAALQDAYDSGDPARVKEAQQSLKTVIKKCAKDIHDKYIYPPYTTNFAIMFLPFEGLYAEVVNSGLVELLQRDYSVNIAGPSTTAAMLNSLQMGFRTLQIQKRSNEVWNILSAVKTEFESFEKVFKSAKNRIRQLDEDMDKLIGVRTTAIRKKLLEVQTMDSEESGKVLGIEEGSGEIGDNS